MTYFAILGKNKEISIEELKLVKPVNLLEINNILVTFETEKVEELNNLWWFIKWWEIVDKDWLKNRLEWQKILWTKDKDFWIRLKKEFWIKRFKLVDLFKTDKEVKNKWVEVVKIQNNYGVVLWYQNIGLYEEIDFSKPSRSMKMWMMPAKFTHIMLNIWLWICKKRPVAIYDPFAWSGTTWFLANHFWYDFFWSDIDIQHLEKNREWWLKNPLHTEKKFEILKHDITKEIPNDFLDWDVLVVSEWWLWPIVFEKSTQVDIMKYQNQVWDLYKKFVTTISKTRDSHHTKAVFTIPYYINQSNFLEQEIKTWSSTFGWKMSSIDEVYSRENQKVWRKIIVLE